MAGGFGEGVLPACFGEGLAGLEAGVAGLGGGVAGFLGSEFSTAGASSAGGSWAYAKLALAKQRTSPREPANLARGIERLSRLSLGRVDASSLKPVNTLHRLRWHQEF